MASRIRQSELRRRLPTLVPLALIVTALTAAPTPAAAGYEPPRGDQFFLLSDASVGSDGVAIVRLEAPAGAPYGHVERYGGADIVVYRISDPMTFLKRQPNLHRVEVKGRYTGEGLANTVSHLWSEWNRQARRSWQRLFAEGARKAVTTQAPETKAPPGGWAVDYESQPQWAPIPGLPVVDTFRYPIWQAKPIEPPAQVKLAGSSSEWLWTRGSRGNVLVPIGRRAPGLYLVEAIIGSHRATALVFVSDTVALTKISAGELLVWTVDRKTGHAVGGVEVAWTDGLGTLQSATTGADGIAVLRHASPERTWVIGRDRDGGVFVSENFYYDSEIYDTKLYAVTDRPLYRPGDVVHLKLLAREFKDARRSQPAAGGPVALTVLDPTGTPVATRTLMLSPVSGAHTSVELPANSVSGGYDVRLEYDTHVYGAAFRVADYVKPHFEIDVRLDRPEPKTREPITGRVVLRYPDGGPVRGAAVQLVVKSQALTMVDTELRYADRAPVKLESDELTSDDSGAATFTLPAAEQPSRYIVTLLATDAAAYRVRTTKEILIERGAALFTLTAPRRFSAPGETVTFTISPAHGGPDRPVRWQRVRLENRARDEGLVHPGGSLPLIFAEPGSYTVSLRDAMGRLVGATSHWVAGPGLAAAPGTAEIVLDRERYKPGDVARALITFSEPVDEALLTLERDRVERHARLTAPAPWVRVARLGPTQWRAEMPVRPEHAPNVTFSVLYARGGDYVFANRGLRVEQDSVALAFRTERETYRPGESVRVEVTSTIGGKPAPARLTISVVDEMIYVLQPEIAPDVLEFFYHPRRNNVRTSSSLTFISYDMAVSALPSPPPRSGANSRAVKVLERPRRDVADTALWIPDLITDAQGRATFTFTMPDALGRWRITGRAMTDAGIVGQRSAWVASDMPMYLKWAGPTQFRQGDAPVADVVVFNRTAGDVGAELVATGAGSDSTRHLRLGPGANHLALPLALVGDGPVTLQLREGGVAVDTLTTRLSVSSAHWTSPRSITVPITGASTPLALPPDAQNVSVAFATPGPGAFTRIVDDLVEYPWGCVEQTASRLIPLALAYPRFAGGPTALREALTMRLQTNRLRLVHMAGPDAVFAWWGLATTQSALMTAYAYYADWHAARVLGVSLPPEHWTRLLDVYRTRAAAEPVLHRALAVWFMGEIGLPTKTLVDGLQDDIAAGDAAPARWRRVDASPLLADPTSSLGRDIAVVLVAHMAARNGQALRGVVASRLAAARDALAGSGLPVARALLVLGDPAAVAREAGEILESVRQEMPTLDRALTLVWLQKAMGLVVASPAPLALGPDWTRTTSWMGDHVWRFRGQGRPDALQLAAAPATPVVAIVRYDSAEVESHRLPVRIERRLQRLRPDGKLGEMAATPVDEAQGISSRDLYIEEVTLTPEPGTRLRFAALEVPLPPGADIERTTWGMQVRFGHQARQPLERARHETGDLRYVVPIDLLDAPLTIRHLVRFSQRGRFVLPPARLFRMYDPDDKAFEGEGTTARVVDVR
jgi:uncharacterized protein YfaS (alpha-2-macroglobulin family)